MKNSSLVELSEFVNERSFRTVSFDIDGTVYPIRKIQIRWWKKLFASPARALRFYQIKSTWEKRRKGGDTHILADDIKFFEEFLTEMMDESLVPDEIRDWIAELKNCEIEVYFLSDHGAAAKLSKLGLAGIAINCLTETGELKPHQKISALLHERYKIDPAKHIHFGDRWSDEEQAKLFGCSFRYLNPR